MGGGSWLRGGEKRKTRPSSGEERGNETGKVAIAHGSVEFCEAAPIAHADESSESLYGRETDRDHLRNAELRRNLNTLRGLARALSESALQSFYELSLTCREQKCSRK